MNEPPIVRVSLPQRDMIMTMMDEVRKLNEVRSIYRPSKGATFGQQFYFLITCRSALISRERFESILQPVMKRFDCKFIEQCAPVNEKEGYNE